MLLVSFIQQLNENLARNISVYLGKKLPHEAYICSIYLPADDTDFFDISKQISFLYLFIISKCASVRTSLFDRLQDVCIF